MIRILIALAAVLMALAAFATMLQLSARAHAEDKATAACMTYDEASLASHARLAAIEGSTFTEYAGDVAKELAKGVNAVSPVTDYAAERLIAFREPKKTVIGFAIGKCIEHTVRISTDDWDAIRSAVGEAL